MKHGSEKIRLGCIGCGWVLLDLYEPAFEFLENGVVTAVADANPEQARDAGERLGIWWHADYREMHADPSIDAAIILVLTHLHEPVVTDAARAGKHVYCEKPMAVTIEEADSMIAACRENDAKLMIAFMKRFNPSYRMIKRLIDEGALGSVFEARLRWDNVRAGASAKSGYRHSRAAGGGFLQEDGSHPIDQLRWWLGDVEEVSAYALIVAADKVENEDAASVQMKHKSGAISSLHITMLTHATGEESYEIFGIKGRLTANSLYHTTHTQEPLLVRLHERASRVTDLTLPTSWNVRHEYRENWQYLRELSHFCDCVLNDEEPVVTGADGRATVEILKVAFISSRDGVKVKLPLERSPDLREYFKTLQKVSPWRLGDDAWNSRY